MQWTWGFACLAPIVVVAACGGTVETSGPGSTAAGGSSEHAGGTSSDSGGSVQSGSGGRGAGGKNSAGLFGGGGVAYGGTQSAGGAVGAAGSMGGNFPENHRPLPNWYCPASKPAPPPPLPDGGSGIPYCNSSDQCSAQPRGRCAMHEGYGSCVYDDCNSDSECAADELCDCPAFPTNAHRCLKAGCVSDADCGVNGSCSPTYGFCGPYGGYAGYYCHTPEDECVNDIDCGPAGGRDHCAYDATLRHWACSDAFCVG